MIRTGPTHLRLQKTPIVQDVLHQRRPFGTQRSPIDGMVGVAFHMNYLRGYILGLVADRVYDDATAH
jgi:hypothetical protein